MAKPVKIGVIGLGAVTQRGILPHLIQDDVRESVQVEAVCDVSPGRAESVGERFGVPCRFTSLEDLLADDAVEAVTIASPIGLHFEQGRAALLAGKHVHFNKTMSTTVAEATELIDLAKKQRLALVASPGEVLRPHLARTRDLIAEGAIGTLCWAACGVGVSDYHLDEPERQHEGDTPVDPAWYFRKPGGGPLYDVAVYALHRLTTVLGSAQRVTALSGMRIPVRHFDGRAVKCDADDTTLMLLDFGEDVFAVAHGTVAGSISVGTAGTYFGTKGQIVDGYLNGESFLRVPSGPVEDPEPASEQWLLPHVVGDHRRIAEQHVFEDIMQLVDWVRIGKQSPVTGEHARHVVDIIESAYRAAEIGATQELATTVSGLRGCSGGDKSCRPERRGQD